MDTFIRSKENKAILWRFCQSKLRQQWAGQPAALTKIGPLLESALEDALEATVGPQGSYKNWALTSANVGDVNVAIWCHVKAHIEQVLKGLEADPEALLDQMFAERKSLSVEERVDTVTDREFTVFEERHAKLWS